MSDTSSSSQPAGSSSIAGERGRSSSELHKPVVGGSAHPEDQQPTVITNRPPLSAADVPHTGSDVELGTLNPGDHLGHFELLEYVGGGGMGRVFRALDTHLSRIVALKVLPREQATNAETLLRFRNEARSAARLEHENIAQVYHVGEEKGLPYLVFEFIDGIDVRTLVQQKGPLPLAEAVSYTLQVADALAHAASRNVVHRDIKPSNVLITPQGCAKVIDMGLARMQRPGDTTNDLTASGVTLGTFDYISPEQARDPRTVDVRSDIYSLGCTFYYMLTGRPPFPEGTVLQKLLQHQGDEPPELRRFRPDLPDEVSLLLRKMLAKDPRRRFQDPSELVEQFMALAEHVGLRPIGPSHRVWVAPQELSVSFLHRHLPWVAPIAALICIVVFLDFLWSSPARDDTQLPSALVRWPEEDIAPPDPADFASAADKQTKAGPATATTAATPTEANRSGQAAVPKEPVGKATQPPEKPQSPPAADTAGKKTDTRPKASATPPDVNPPSPLDAFATTGTGLRPGTLSAGIATPESGSPGLSASPERESDGAGISTVAEPQAKPAEAGPSAQSPPQRSGVLVVNSGGEGENEFATLNAACSVVTAGDVIELRYNGRREERPIALGKGKITIRAGEGFQPVVVFRPVDPDPVKCPRSMLMLTDSRLTLVNMAVELDIPRNVPADRWSLVKMGRTDSVRLEKCSLTVRNASDKLAAYHQEVAFFRIRAAPDTKAVMGDRAAKSQEEAAARPTARIELADCIVRGEATLAWVDKLQPIHLTWVNGLLTTTERLLRADGGEKGPQPGQKLQIDLQHLTIVARSGLCSLNSSKLAPHQLPIQVNCADSILIGSADSPLIEQVIAQSGDKLQEQTAWNGDRNFYEKFAIFWSKKYLDSEDPPEQMNFDAWRAYWGLERENLPIANRVGWKELPELARPLHTHAPANYALTSSEVSENPALGAASDGRDVGFQADLLPQLPPPAKSPAADAATGQAPGKK